MRTHNVISQTVKARFLSQESKDSFIAGQFYEITVGINLMNLELHVACNLNQSLLFVTYHDLSVFNHEWQIVEETDVT